MNIAIQINRKYLNYAGVMMTSLCINNPVHIELYVLNADLTKDDIEMLEDILGVYDVSIHDVKVNTEDYDERLPLNDGWTLEVYFKLKLPDLLPPETERVLFLDVDIIVNGSLEELYQTDFEGKDLLAAPDANGTCTLDMINKKQYEMFSGKFGEDYVYFNSGSILVNLPAMRERYSYDSYIKAMEEWEYDLCAVDQDLLNYVHGENVGYLDWKRFNLCARVASHKLGMDYEYVKDNATIIHYTGTKPWRTENTLHYDIERLWWDYARMTPVYDLLADDFIRSTLDNKEFEERIYNTFEENRKLHELLNKCT